MKEQKWMVYSRNGVCIPYNAALFDKGGWAECASPIRPSPEAKHSTTMDEGAVAMAVTDASAPEPEKPARKKTRTKKPE